MPVTVDLHSGSRFVIPDRELVWRFSASGGPGGQHANRASTRAELSWSIAASEVLTAEQRSQLSDVFGPQVSVAVDEHRSQLRNRETARRRLAQRCRDALQTPASRTATKPSRGAKRRRLDAKRRVGKTKQLRRKPSRDD